MAQSVPIHQLVDLLAEHAGASMRASPSEAAPGQTAKAPAKTAPPQQDSACDNLSTGHETAAPPGHDEPRPDARVLTVTQPSPAANATGSAEQPRRKRQRVRLAVASKPGESDENGIFRERESIKRHCPSTEQQTVSTTASTASTPPTCCSSDGRAARRLILDAGRATSPASISSDAFVQNAI